MQTLLLGILAALCIFFVSVTVILAFTQEKVRLRQRLQTLSDKKEQSMHPAQKTKQKRRRISVSKVFSNEIISAGIRMRPEEFLMFWFAAAFVPSGLLILFRAHTITILAVFIVGMIIPPIILKRAKKKRLLLFDKQLSDALMLIGNCLRSGLTFQQAIANIAKEMSDPIGREFARTAKEIRLGNSLDTALSNMMQRVQSTDLMLMISAVQIQREVGGNLIEILDNISETVKERLKLRDDIKMMTSSGRISSVVVGLLPVVIGVLLMILNPGYIQTFFEKPLGIAMLIFAAAMEVIGFLVIKKIVTIKY